MKLETFNKWLNENGYTQHPQIGGGYFKNVGFTEPVGFIVAENGDVDYCQLSNGYPVVIKCSCLADLSINNEGKLAASWKKTGRKVLV